MGSYLDKPETTKKSAIDENDYYLVGSSSMQVSIAPNVPLIHSISSYNEINSLLTFTGMAHKSGSKLKASSDAFISIYFLLRLRADF